MPVPSPAAQPPETHLPNRYRVSDPRMQAIHFFSDPSAVVLDANPRVLLTPDPFLSLWGRMQRTEHSQRGHRSRNHRTVRVPVRVGNIAVCCPLF